MSKIDHKVAIIGSGPAGLTAAIYAARANLNPVVFAGLEFGGQLMGTTVVENFPGFPEGVDGPVLMQNMIKQAEHFGAELRYNLVEGVDFSEQPFKLKVNGEYQTAEAVIIATGSSPRKLGLEAESKFWGRGVSTCATCDGALFREKEIAVIGGGDSAMEEALFLTQHASKVYIIHRRDSFRASHIMQERVLKNKKIEVVWDTVVTDIMGDQTVSGLTLKNSKTNEESQLDLAGVFLAIGHVPQTAFLQEQIALTEDGYISTDDGVRTSVEGVFVAGDVEDWVYRQAITAAGAGCKSALAVQRWLEE